MFLSLALCACGAVQSEREGVPQEAWSQRVARQGERAVLRVISDGGGVGSGFVIHPAGLAITNAHVVQASKGGVVEFSGIAGPGGPARFEVLALGPSRDLALLQVLGAARSEYGALELGSSKGLELGAPVLAIGAPQGMFPIVTTGVFGGRSVPGTIADLLVPEQLIHGAPTLRGSSGCALLDSGGRVVGVQSAKPSQELVKAADAEDEAGRLFDRDLGRWRFQTEAFGLAVPVEDVRRYVPAWVAPEWTTRLATGFRCDPLGDGAVVLAVSDGSPAAQAGLRVGDEILEVGGQPVWSVVDLSVWLSSPGSTQMSVARGDTRRELEFQREPWSVPDWDSQVAGGLRWREARGWHSMIPDFSEQSVVESGLVSGLHLPPEHEGRDEFVLEFSGWLDVPEGGNWVFELVSDDGSQLFLRDRLVVDLDGLHGAQAATGAVELEPGPQPVRVMFFEAGGEESLQVRWGREGEPLKAVPEDRLGHTWAHEG